MTKLAWSHAEAPHYESGVDRGVLYPETGIGVSWNGLVSVQETSSGGEAGSYYFDGIKYVDQLSPTTFRATITAFSKPKEFASALGDLAIAPGFILTRQPRSRFGLSYRSLIGDGLGYKLHIVYNALATPSKRGYSTNGATPQAENFSWQIDAVPPLSDTYRPSAHFIIDSTKIDPVVYSTVEEILYGSDSRDPRLPLINELIDLVGSWNPVLIVPQTVTGLAQLTDGLGDLNKTSIDGLYRSLSTTRLVDTNVDGFYRLET